MCYHTTFLFSLCGHISVSPNPVRNTPRCEIATSKSAQGPNLSTAKLSQAVGSRSTIDNSTQSPVQSREISGRLSHHSVTSPFPSPQEFEFVQQAHDVSIPASPATPSIARKWNERDSRPHSGYSDDILASYGNSSPILPVLEGAESKLNTKLACPIIARHPLQTYILPNLCRSCRLSREQNMARFELQVMKESVEREQSGPQGVIDAQRKRIHRRSAGKGKLIPLICVEEHRLGKEMMNERAGDNDSQRQSLMSGTGVAERASENFPPGQTHIDADDDTRSVAGSSIDSKQTRNSATKETPTKMAGNALASWGRSWWTKSTSSVPNSATLSQPPTPLPQMLTQLPPRESEDRDLSEFATQETSNELQHKQELENAPSRKPSTDVDWSATQETWNRISSEVKRDVHGRNASAMSKIMAFDTGGMDSGVRKMK